MVVQCPGCQQYYEVGDRVSMCPICNIALNGSGSIQQSPVINRASNKFCKFGAALFGIFALIVLLVVGGILLFRGRNALDYVPEDAEFVIYGNTDMLLDSKSWQVAENCKDFRDFMDEFVEELDIDDVEDLRGTIAFFGDVPDGPFTAVIVLENNNAQDIYDLLMDQYDKDYYEIDEDDIDDCPAFSVKSEYSDRCIISVAMISDDTLQIVFNDEIDELVEPDCASDIAQEIDRDAVFAAAGASDLWGELEDLFRNDGVRIDLDGLGVAKLEVFADDSNVKVVFDLDISDVDGD